MQVGTGKSQQKYGPHEQEKRIKTTLQDIYRDTFAMWCVKSIQLCVKDNVINNNI